jgi:hypothetical protein
MKLNPESFKGKIYLLVIDKIIIGAIIAVAFLVYDRFRTIEAQNLQASAATIQLTFERARLAKEFLPFILNKKEDVIARGYTLREAARTGSIDADAAVDIGRQLLADGIPDNHFRKVMAVVVPDGVSAIARRGVEMSAGWGKISKDPFDPATTFDPVSGKENIPDEFVPLIHEGRLWRAVLVEGFSDTSRTTCDNFQDASKFAPQLYGLFVLMHAGSQPDAIELSRSRCHAVSLVGHLSRVLLSGRDAEAVRYLSGELSLDHTAMDNLRVDRVILGILSTFGMPIHEGVSAGAPSSLAIPIAQILVEPPSPRGSQPGVPEAHYWLQWETADALELMARTAKEDHLESDPSRGARPAESVLISFLSQFATDVLAANDKDSLESLLNNKYGAGDLVRRIVTILGSFDSKDAQAVLSKVRSVGPDKLRYFPFLEEDLDRSIKK